MWAALPRPETWEPQYLLPVLVPASSTLLTSIACTCTRVDYLWLFISGSENALPCPWLPVDLTALLFYVTTLAYYIFKRKRGVPVILVEGLPWLSHNMVETPYWSLVWGCLKAHSRNRQLLRVCTWNTHSPPLHPHLTLVVNPCSLDVVLFYRTTETLGGGTWLVEAGHRDGPVRIMSSWVPVGLSASCLLWCEQPLHVFPLL